MRSKIFCIFVRIKKLYYTAKHIFKLRKKNIFFTIVYYLYLFFRYILRFLFINNMFVILFYFISFMILLPYLMLNRRNLRLTGEKETILTHYVWFEKILNLYSYNFTHKSIHCANFTPIILLLFFLFLCSSISK